MRAIIYDCYGGPEVLRLAELADPIPRKAEVQVTVLACGINLSDWENLTGRPAYARLGGLFKPGKQVLGSDIVGTITAVGSGVTKWCVGDRVWAEVVMQGGGFATRAVLPAKRLARVPDALDDVTAAALPQPGSIALAGMRGAQDGQRVLINGAGGGSGPLAMQLAKAAGAYVTAVDTGAKAAFLTKCGADQVIDYQQTDFTAEDAKYDLILDLVGTRPMRDIGRVLAKGGRYRLIGGTIRAMFSALFVGAAYRVLHGVKMGVAAAEGDPKTLDRIGMLAANGDLSVQIAGTVSLAGVSDALVQVGRGEVAGKLVVLPGS